MSTLQRLTFAFLAFVLVAPAIGAFQVPINATAPKLTGFSVQGESINLELLRGKKNVLVVFYRTYD